MLEKPWWAFNPPHINIKTRKMSVLKDMTQKMYERRPCAVKQEKKTTLQ